MGTSKSFGRKSPVREHLIHPGAGLAGEIDDLRKDIDEAFGDTETPGHGGTGVVAVEEFTNVVAADDDAIKTSIATSLSAASYSGAALNGIKGTGTMSPPRNITITCAGGNGHAPAHAHVTGLDVNGAAITEQIAINQGGGVTAGSKAFASITLIEMAAGTGVGDTLKFGFGTVIGLGSKVKVRNTIPNIIAEMMDGAFITGGGVGAVTATNQDATATNQNATPTITVDKLRQQQNLGALAAPGANYVAQYAGGAAINDAVGPFAKMVPPRTVQIARGGAGVATVYTITGTDCTGAVLTETINSNGAVTVQGTRAFTTITEVESDVDPTVTTDVEVGNGFGLGCVASDVDAVGVDGALEAPVSSHAATGTVVPTTVPNGAHLFVVDYRILPTASQAAHTHVQDAHTHVQDAHTHAGSAGTFVAPATGAPNGTYSPATAPNGAHDYVVVYERDNS